MGAFGVCWIRGDRGATDVAAAVFWISSAARLGRPASPGPLSHARPGLHGDVNARADQPVIDRGPYRWVRHPSYTAGLVLFGGIGLALGNWLSLVFLGVTIPFVYAYRVRVEERALLTAIGEPYRRFMETRKRFYPYVF